MNCENAVKIIYWPIPNSLPRNSTSFRRKTPNSDNPRVLENLLTHIPIAFSGTLAGGNRVKWALVNDESIKSKVQDTIRGERYGDISSLVEEAKIKSYSSNCPVALGLQSNFETPTTFRGTFYGCTSSLIEEEDARKRFLAIFHHSILSEGRTNY